MTRLRIWFAVVAFASVLAVGALVWRALAVADTERRLRHDAVAERVLDEMERSLSDLVAAEEAAADPSHDFIVARYELDAAGAVSTVSHGRRDQVERWVSDGRDTLPTAGPFTGARQSAGTTLPVAPSPKPALESETLAEAQAPQKKEAIPEAFEVLGKLNRAGEERAKRQRAPSESKAKDAFRSFDDADTLTEDDVVVSSPLRARALDASHLALERDVASSGRTSRRGLVIAAPGLFAWLRNETLGGELASLARVDFAGPLPSELPAVESEFVYRRRFAEPFEALGAQLVLAPLPGVGTAGAIQALGAALAAVLLVGLAVAYRTVATVVAFAERRAAFAASVSHELKTPLTAIRMYAEMLRDGIVTSEEKRAEYYRALAVESDRLSRLVNNVLEFSQLEKGARRLALGVAPVEPALREALEILRVHVEAEGFRLSVEIAPDLPPARFERDALAQIVFNLVDNATKYARAAERREVIVTLGPTPSGVALGVRDFGPGVPRDQLELVFEPFWRGDSELTRRAKGTGIGLALVRRLAEAMGGSARARNAEPAGFAVEVELARG